LITVKYLFISSILLLGFQAFGQTLIINEFSNGPSGTQEYVELIVVDTSSGNSNCSNCIDIRGWIIDDNNGFHGSSGIASGCNRFSNDVFWSCIPLGTSITVYNGTDPNIDLPVDDLDINDGNCNLVLPIENLALFETNPNTPGAIVCDYPNLGWNPGGIWSRIGMRNAGDCIRLVDLTGCEIFSLSYGDISLNSTIYFPGSGTDDVFFFSGTNPYLQSDWAQGCAGDAGACLGNDQSPGAANSNLNSDYIDQFTVNGCQPTIPISLILTNQSNSCGDCTGSITLNAVQGQGLYTFNISPTVPITSNPSTSPITVDNICSGEYVATVIDENGCEDAQNFEIENDTPPTITTSNNVSVCNGGSIELNAILGGSASAISWVSPDGSFSNINNTTTTFTPSINNAIAFVVVTAESENCGTIQENIFVNVTSPSDPIFSQLAAQCEGAIFSLNTTSTNGIEGTWTPEINNEITTTYTFLADANQCANNQAMTVSIIPATDSTLSQTICASELPLLWNGLLFNSPGTQTTTLTSISGCDSIISMDLIVNDTLSSIETLSLCPSELPFEWNGLELNSAGTESITLSSIDGCDSTAIVVLNILPELSSTSFLTICENTLPYNWNGITFNSSEVQSVVLQSITNGCDSTATLNLSVNNNVSITLDTTICENELPYFWNNITFNSTGSETITLQSSTGCDSVITMNLLVYPSPELPMLDLNNSYCLYETPEPIILPNNLDNITWYTDNNLTEILSTQNQYTPEVLLGTNAYYVTASENGCEGSAQIILIEFVACEITIPTAFTPNGDQTNDIWNIESIDVIYPENLVSIYNRWGNKIFESKRGMYSQNPWNGRFKGEEMPVASYFYIIEFNDGKTKPRNGIVSIIK
jgi:gliding motility-associated-like protein